MGEYQPEPTTTSSATDAETQGLPESQEAPAFQDPDSGRHADLTPQGAPADLATTLPHCGSCRIGLLYPIAYDPEATHEANQGLAVAHEQYVPSGGSVIVRCFNCGNQQSEPLNAGGDQ